LVLWIIFSVVVLSLAFAAIARKRVIGFRIALLLLGVSNLGSLMLLKLLAFLLSPKVLLLLFLEGFILFHGRSIRVLFDTGASHSFVSKELVDVIPLDVVSLCDPLRIVNPIGGSATLGLLCVDVEIILCGFSFHANLQVMDHLGFYMILGMDWLVRYEVQILCPERTLYLKHLDAIEELSIIFLMLSFLPSNWKMS